MNAPTEVQTILDGRGRPAFAVLPIALYEDLLERARHAAELEEKRIPNEVVNLMFDGSGMNAARAWREHLGLTQSAVAARMGITQAALAQIETAKRPRKATRAKLADALGVSIEQLAV